MPPPARYRPLPDRHSLRCRAHPPHRPPGRPAARPQAYAAHPQAQAPPTQRWPRAQHPAPSRQRRKDVRMCVCLGGGMQLPALREWTILPIHLLHLCIRRQNVKTQADPAGFLSLSWQGHGTAGSACCSKKCQANGAEGAHFSVHERNSDFLKQKMHAQINVRYPSRS
eukprot:1159045-Pelagomonas_calceolata.AAC.10